MGGQGIYNIIFLAQRWNKIRAGLKREHVQSIYEVGAGDIKARVSTDNCKTRLIVIDNATWLLDTQSTLGALGALGCYPELK